MPGKRRCDLLKRDYPARRRSVFHQHCAIFEVVKSRVKAGEQGVHILLWLFVGFITAAVASYKGRSLLIWFFAGLIFPVFSTIIVMLLPPAGYRTKWEDARGTAAQSSRSGKINVTCPYCGSHVIIDNIPGSWVCSHCDQPFTYSTDGRIYKQRQETVPPAVELMVKLFAKVAKADGVVTATEVEKVDGIVKAAFRPSEAELSEIRQIFNDARYSADTYQELCNELYFVVQGREDILKDFLTAVFAIAFTDGSLSIDEQRMIRYAADHFGLSSEYEQLKAAFLGYADSHASNRTDDLTGSYQILGCRKGDSAEIIKKNYRRLIKENHPDHLLSQGASDEAINQANKKVAEIKKAYERVMAAI